MKKLWIFCAGLSVVYLLVWMAMSATDTEQANVTPAVVASPTIQTLSVTDRAKADAASRVPAGSKLEVVTLKPAKFVGANLEKEVAITDPDGVTGTVVTLVATVEGQEASKLVYHVTADKIVFVSQSNVK